MPRVSVIIPTYNRARIITRAVESALAQRAASVEVEVIVVDDGSTDGTRGLLASYGERIVVVRLENGGPARARNRGFAIAGGECVSFLDSDDAFYPGALASAAEALEQAPGFDAAYGRAFNVDPAGRVISEWQTAASTGDIFGSILRGHVLQLGQCLFRRAALQAGGYGYDEAVPYGHEDYKFQLLFARRHPFRFVDRPFLRRTVHPGMLTPVKVGGIVEQRLHAIDDLFGEEAPALRRQFLTRRVVADWYRSDAFVKADAGNVHEAKRFMLASLRQWPCQWNLYPWLLYQTLPQNVRTILRKLRRPEGRRWRA